MSGVEDLLGHERWVRRLARALIRDEDEAEDVVQEARLASWRHPPRAPRLWLGRVVRNLVRNRLRASTRRARLHEAWSPAEAPSNPEQLGERLEAHRGLAEAVAHLPEAFRDVVLVRYYEELNSTEIAARLGVPAGTVRWRLKEAIDRLRTDLDERPRTRRWIVLLAARPLRRRPVLAAVVVLAGASAVVVGGTFGHRRAAVPERSPRRPVASFMARPPSLVSGDDLPAWTQLEGAPRRGIAGRVSSQGRPVPGAELRLSSGILPSARELDRRQQTGKDGAFAFPPQAPTGWYLTASAPGLEPRVLNLDLRLERPTAAPGGQAIEGLVIDLPPCRAFATGLVRDDGGGVLVGARVRVTASGNNGGTGEASDGSGRYRLCLPTTREASYALVAEKAGYGALETRAPDRSATVDFTLAAQVTLTGRAVRDDDGEPVARAHIALVPPATRPPAGRTQPVRTVVRADDDGRFEVPGLAPGRYDLRVASDEAMRVAGDVVELAPGESPRELEVRLFPVAVVEGTTFRAGTPAPEAELLFRSRPSSPRRLEGAWARSNAQGRFRVRLPRDADLEIVSPDPAGPGRPWLPVVGPKALRVEAQARPLRVELAGQAPATDLVSPPGVQAPPPQHPLPATFGAEVRLLGYDLSSERISRGGKVEVTVHYRVLAPTSGLRLFNHLEGPGGFRNLDHGPARGEHPVEVWAPGETIRDRFTISADERMSPGSYTLFVGFRRSDDDRRLAVTPAVTDDRLPVLSFAVE